jgi:predicted DNA binding CopG/RHH family protein
MGYSDLIEKGASKQELKEFFAGGGQTAITIRIPANLRDAFREEAELRGMNFSAFLRMCMIQELSKRG